MWTRGHCFGAAVSNEIMQSFIAYRMLFVIFRTALFLLPVCAAASDISVTDDSGRTITLTHPAKKVVSLAPHLTELMFSAGAGNQLVGISKHCDYPPQADGITKVSDYRSVNYELLATLNPDLVLVWDAGLKPDMLERLRVIGNEVYVSKPLRFEDIAANLQAIGKLTGNEYQANRLSADFMLKVARLKDNAPKSSLRTFYLLWSQPPMTVARSHWISRTIEICGGTNIYSGKNASIPVVNREFLLTAEIDLIIQSTDETFEPNFSMPFFGRLIPTIYANPDMLQRPSLRLVNGAERLCREMARFRN